MGYTLYSYPEKFGLTVVAELDFGDEPYTFDKRIVWKDRENKLWTARDSGCSCPEPFEDMGLDDLEPLNIDFIVDEVHSELQSKYCQPDPGACVEFYNKIREELQT